MHATHRLFVYGTLLPGEPRWSMLEHCAETAIDATAAGTLWDTGRGYPAAVFSGSAEIQGAVVAIPPDRWDEVVDLLDQVEGEGVLYRRVEIETSAGPATSYEWLGPTEGMTPLPSGWRNSQKPLS
jgi:gamma-glutamylcyclotransferase (GGCT)/AIG2-like uncharacterized protein YtfP